MKPQIADVLIWIIFTQGFSKEGVTVAGRHWLQRGIGGSLIGGYSSRAVSHSNEKFSLFSSSNNNDVDNDTRNENRKKGRGSRSMIFAHIMRMQTNRKPRWDGTKFCKAYSRGYFNDAYAVMADRPEMQ